MRIKQSFDARMFIYKIIRDVATAFSIFDALVDMVKLTFCFCDVATLLSGVSVEIVGDNKLFCFP